MSARPWVSDRVSLAKWALGGVACAAILVGVALLSHLPMGQAEDDSELRLALRTAAARIEICRDLTAEELAALPAHQRAPRTCEESPVDYRLTVTIDGTQRIDQSIRHRGIRRTRPLAVDEVLRVEPGAHRVEVRFEPELAEFRERQGKPAIGDENDDASHGESAEARVSAALEALSAPALDAVVEFAPGRARIVRIDERGALALAPAV